jgi:hypothetical protein
MDATEFENWLSRIATPPKAPCAESSSGPERVNDFDTAGFVI